MQISDSQNYQPSDYILEIENFSFSHKLLPYRSPNNMKNQMSLIRGLRCLTMMDYMWFFCALFNVICVMKFFHFILNWIVRGGLCRFCVCHVIRVVLQCKGMKRKHYFGWQNYRSNIHESANSTKVSFKSWFPITHQILRLHLLPRFIFCPRLVFAKMILLFL